MQFNLSTVLTAYYKSDLNLKYSIQYFIAFIVCIRIEMFKESRVLKKVVKVQTNVRIARSSSRQFFEINQIYRSAGAILVKK